MCSCVSMRYCEGTELGKSYACVYVFASVCHTVCLSSLRLHGLKEVTKRPLIMLMVQVILL